MGTNFFIIMPVLLICMMSGILLTTRFLLYKFVYFLHEGEFFVYLVYGQGQKRRLECRLYTYLFVEILPLADAKIKHKKSGQISKTYNYCNSPFPKNAYSMLFISGEKLERIIFEPDKGMLKRIKESIHN